MIEGVWEGAWQPTDGDGEGTFVRKPSAFRDRLAPERPEPGRYHLFVAWTCPWAHRTLLARSLKGLTELIPVHFANELTEQSWRFEDRSASPHADEYLYELYLRADSAYTGRVTVPVLWDEHEQRVVNNESSERLSQPPSASRADPRCPRRRRNLQREGGTPRLCVDSRD